MYKAKTELLSLAVFFIGILGLSCLSTNIFNQQQQLQQNQALAQQYIQTIKHRNLVIGLGNGVKTKETVRMNSESTLTNLQDMQNILTNKVHVGDINVAYKTFGKGNPILLISGSGLVMGAWDHSVLKDLSTIS